MTKISIITPTYNAERYFEQNIKSIISQKFENIEHIIVDSESTDDTIKIINNYRDHFSKIIVEKDFGIYDGMNKGIMSAKGDIIGILNADDYYNNGALKLVSKTYEYSSKKDIIHGRMNIVYKNMQSLSLGDLSDKAFKNGHFKLNHSATFVPKSIYDKLGLFDIKYKSGADREFLLRAYHKNVKFLQIEKPLANFRIGGFSSSYNLKIIFSRTKEEYEIFKIYYPWWQAMQKSIEQGFRMIRNAIFSIVFGNDRFLKTRIKLFLKK